MKLLPLDRPCVRWRISAEDRRHITQDPQICFGQPCIKGTRIRVLDIVIEYERLGRSPDQIAEAHPGLTLPDIHAALVYYYEHREEVDRAIRAERRLVQQIQREFAIA